jgi:hypothetical protein
MQIALNANSHDSYCLHLIEREVAKLREVRVDPAEENEIIAFF